MRMWWWVTLKITYLHQNDKEVEGIPHLSCESEEYVVCKIAQAINKDNMSEHYYTLNNEIESKSKFDHHALVVAFQKYLERPCVEGAENTGGLARIINCWTKTFNWPIPDEHFRRLYE